MNNKYKTIDLCGRLPYGVFCRVPECTDTPIRVTTVNAILDCVVLGGGITPLMYDEWLAYLRPLSSMTEEERRSYEWTMLHCSTSISDNIMLFEWLNAHHFDYRGLISKGLALEAPEGMYDF